MPCSGGYESNNVVIQTVESGVQTQRLCAVFTALARKGLLDKVLSEVDWREAGVSHVSTMQWWLKHQKEDKRRIEREQAQKKQREERAKVLAKLSPSDKALLGIKE